MTEAMQQEALRALLALEWVSDAAPEDVYRHKSRIRFSLLVLEGLADTRDGDRLAFARRMARLRRRSARCFAPPPTKTSTPIST